MDSENISTTRRRWLVLFVFCFYSLCNAVQWIEYSILPDIFTEYYDVSYSAISWTAMMFSATMVIFTLPAALLLEYTNLRTIVITGATFNVAGAIIKCFSASQDLWWLTLTGQIFSGMTMPFLLQVPPRLAAIWFPSDEVSTATSFGVFGNQLGVALGFVIPPLIVKGPIDAFNDNGAFPIDWSNTTLYPEEAEQAVAEVTTQLEILYITIAVVSGASYLLILFLFKNEPTYPPSVAEHNRRIEEHENTNSHGDIFVQSMKNLMGNKSYVLLLISYGLNGGCYYALSTLIAQIIKPSLLDLDYTSSELDAKIGYMGLVFVVAGLFGAIIGGVALDKTKKFKLITIGTYVGTLVFMGAFAALLFTSNIPLDFTLISFLGLFMTGYLPIGFEFGAEITYPENEGTSSGLLNMSIGAFALILTSGGQAILELEELDSEDASLYANIVMIGSLFIGTIMTFMIKEVLHRQNAQLDSKDDAGIENKVYTDEITVEIKNL